MKSKTISATSNLFFVFFVLTACNQTPQLTLKGNPVNTPNPQTALNQAKKAADAAAKASQASLLKVAPLKNTDAPSAEDSNPDGQGTSTYTKNEKAILAFFRSTHTGTHTATSSGQDTATDTDQNVSTSNSSSNQHQQYLDLLAFQSANAVDCMYPRRGQIEWAKPMDANTKEYAGDFKVHITCVGRFSGDVDFDTLKRYSVSGTVDPNTQAITWAKTNDPAKDFDVTPVETSTVTATSTQSETHTGTQVSP